MYQGPSRPSIVSAGIHRSAGLLIVLILGGALANCSSAPPASGARGGAEAVGTTASPLATEDGLAEAYGVFKSLFTQNAQDQHYVIGFGYHAGLSTQKILVNGTPVNGQATINFVTGTVTANLNGPDDGTVFDLYFVKNSPTAGTVRPESVDTMFKVGSFVSSGISFEPNLFTLSAQIGTAPFPQQGVNFDLDMVVITLHGQSPLTSVIATGARTLFEKRFFRERAGASLDPVTLARANFVETNDSLVQAGAQLFVNETFGGNGRQCQTCHPLANNQTLDPAFVAALPPTDPLFNFPSGLEDRAMLAQALTRENVDGFEDPTVKFVERAIPHTLSLSTSIGVVGTGLGFSGNAGSGIDGPPPDQRTGWSGDGAPGRGTLNEFAFGAIIQHFTKSLRRVAGTDFRVPTQAELDALEAFQLFSGRQSTPVTTSLTFADPVAQAGMLSANREGACSACHQDLGGVIQSNLNANTGIEKLPISFRTATNMPSDGGFGPAPGTLQTGFGSTRFNVPPLFEAAMTPPFFHNNAITDIEDAVAFYQSTEFLDSPATQFAIPQLTTTSIQNIAGFLRTLSALTNIARVRKRVLYLEANATEGGTTIMTQAIADAQSAVRVLTAPELNGTSTLDAINALKTVALSLQDSLPYANNQPSVPMSQVATWLTIAKMDLLPASQPNQDF
jgi:hypothetical protein